MAGAWKTILVGTDGSERAAKAVDHAARLAAATGAGLVVVTVYNPDPPLRSERPDGIPEDVRWATTPGAAADETAASGAAAARAAGAAGARGRAVPGQAAEALLEVAADEDASLIVLGSKGMGSPSRFLLGSVPNNVAHHAGCDILIVRTA